MIFKHAGDPPKFGRFTVTKHPYLRALTPKKSKRKKKYVPYELGSQIVLRIFIRTQNFRNLSTVSSLEVSSSRYGQSNDPYLSDLYVKIHQIIQNDEKPTGTGV